MAANPYEAPATTGVGGDGDEVLGEFRGRVLPTVALMTGLNTIVWALGTAVVVLATGRDAVHAGEAVPSLLLVLAWSVVTSVGFSLFYRVRLTRRGIRGLDTHCMPATATWAEVTSVRQRPFLRLPYIRVRVVDRPSIWCPLFLRDEEAFLRLVAQHLHEDQIA